ncbi:MAG: hypothetical protein KQJ78_12845 [Deltaproteobacteria bacterium]|nr:hypothetical protein [Deltaproteobacteria bacterium]
MVKEPGQAGPLADSWPEKARMVQLLAEGGFPVPPFVYVPAGDFEAERFTALEGFLEANCEGDYKVIVRSCHPQEQYYKGGTFDSVVTYADIKGIKYARRRIIKMATAAKNLAILRQQRFNRAPLIHPGELGVIVMPFVEGTNVMAKKIGAHWEFGYCRDRNSGFQSEPFITHTPHDQGLLHISEDIQRHLGVPCEIEYVISPQGEIYVVQAKDISKVANLEMRESELAVSLDGVHRIRRRRNYRERPIYLMDNMSFYLELIGQCEEMVHGDGDLSRCTENVLRSIAAFEEEMVSFALTHERFAVLGLSIEVPQELYQIANHYLDDTPAEQKRISEALYANLYKVDQFLSEADTLVAKDKFRRNLCSHDAYGIDTVRTPHWAVYWLAERHREVIREFRQKGYQTGDFVGIELDASDRPLIYQL